MFELILQGQKLGVCVDFLGIFAKNKRDKHLDMVWKIGSLAGARKGSDILKIGLLLLKTLFLLHGWVQDSITLHTGNARCHSKLDTKRGRCSIIYSGMERILSWKVSFPGDNLTPNFDFFSSRNTLSDRSFPCLPDFTSTGRISAPTAMM